MRNQRPTFAKSANAKQVLHSTVAASNSGKNSTSTTHHVATTAVLWAKKKKEAPPQTRCVKWDQTKANHATLHAGQSLIRPPDQQGGCSGRWLMQARLTGRARPRSHPEAVHEAKATAAAAANSEGVCAKAASTRRCKAAPSAVR